MTTLQDVLDAIEHNSRAQRASDTAARGTAFEQATQYFLQHDPSWQQRLTAVYLWSDPQNPLANTLSKLEGFHRHDTGIDLVALGQDGEPWAIQCKYYDADHMVSKQDTDSFFNTANLYGVAFNHCILAYIGKGLTGTLAAECRQRHVVILDELALSNQFVDWSHFLQTKPQFKYAPREYQQQAIHDCLHGFETSDRGKLIMACGTGKTLTSLRLVEELYKKAENKPLRVLFLAPSIALVSQTFQYWNHQAKEAMASFVVCSDASASKNDDAWDSSFLSIPFPSTTDSQQLLQQIRQSHKTQPDISVIFSTYQSIEVIIQAQQQGLPEFDIVVCDEAHRTAGTSKNTDKDSPFIQVHDAAKLHARKRLYMTATPRIYAEAAKAQARKQDYTAYSMDDATIFGPEFHALRFGKAVAEGILSDYRVLVLGISQQEADQFAQPFEKSEQAQSFAGKIIGAYNGITTRGVQSSLHHIDMGLGDQVQLAIAAGGG